MGRSHLAPGHKAPFSPFLQSFYLCVREWCLHDAWSPVPMQLVHPHLLLLHLLQPRDPYLTLAGSVHVQASGWVCTVGPAVALTLFFSGACAYTGSQALPRDQRSLFSGPYEQKEISWVLLDAQTEGWRGVLRNHH